MRISKLTARTIFVCAILIFLLPAYVNQLEEVVPTETVIENVTIKKDKPPAENLTEVVTIENVTEPTIIENVTEVGPVIWHDYVEPEPPKPEEAKVLITLELNNSDWFNFYPVHGAHIKFYLDEINDERYTFDGCLYYRYSIAETWEVYENGTFSCHVRFMATEGKHIFWARDMSTGMSYPLHFFVNPDGSVEKHVG